MVRDRSWPNGLVGPLRFLLFLVGIRLLGEILLAIFAPNVIAHFTDSFGRDPRGVGTELSNDANRPLCAHLHTFIQALRNNHGALHTETQFARRILLQLAGCEWRSRVAPTLFLINRTNKPIGFFQGGADLFRIFAVGDFNLLFAFTQKTCVESRWLRTGEMRIDSPVFLLFKSLDFTFAFDDQAQGNGLHTASGKATAYLVP